eukprot:TRINITY_DN3650_c0_g1_i2.p1 TRINITY_DN3650_c0_g1~~TRINITY_DN3650_c0_g1_i2.p1  ORF type:complete len:533 (-),score=138.03 TRINITY_DN3650_c0_g1_i2:138-1736(-)
MNDLNDPFSAETPAGDTPVGQEGSSLRGQLGVAEDFDLDDVKTAATALREFKRPKLTQDHFFEEESGLKKIVKNFPRIRLKGKGNEFEDLRVLLGHYERFFLDLFPQAGGLEDSAWKARSVLQEKDAEVHTKEKLHIFRAVYKKNGGGGTIAGRAAVEKEKAAAKLAPTVSEDARKRIEANRQRALEIKRKRDAAAAGDATNLPEDPRERAEANRARALDIKRRRAEEAEAAALERAFAAAAGQELPPDYDEEDVFGFGNDISHVSTANVQRGTASASSSSGGPVSALAAVSTSAVSRPMAADMFGEEEDPWGFGGDMTQSGIAPPPQKLPIPATGVASAKKADIPAPLPPPSFDDEEDPWGFGFEMDQNAGPPPPQKPPQLQGQQMPPMQAGDVASAKKTEAIAAHPPPSFDDEEDPWGFGFEMDQTADPPPLQKPPQLQEQQLPPRQAGDVASAKKTEATAARPPPSFDEEEDPWSFGFDMDQDASAPPPSQQPQQPQLQLPQKHNADAASAPKAKVQAARPTPCFDLDE